MDKQELRDMYIKKSGEQDFLNEQLPIEYLLNNIAKYADWLEEKIIFNNTAMNKKVGFKRKK